MTDFQSILAVITREFQVLNLVEAGLWIVLGLIAAWQAARRRSAIRRDLLLLAVALVAFGISDIVETRTGAWYRPWWLLLWKAACLAVMLALLVRHVRRRRRSTKAPDSRS